ncbi:MAG: PAS domain-containing protein, partial [Verrucomicrobiae bacterium]|nr:PAS domain-containing protein [Verrucomicrobiae bacterium]
RIAGGFLLLWLTGLVPAVGAEPAHQRVLLIHSFSRDFAPFSVVAERFRTELARQNPQPVELVEVSLQTLSPEEPRQAEALVAYLLATFEGSPPNLIVAIGAPAALFYFPNRDRLFPGVSLLVVGADRRRLGLMAEDEGTVNVSLELDLPLLLEDIVTLQPDVRSVFYVTGITPMDQYWEQEVLKTWRELRSDLNFESMSNRSLAEIVVEVKSLPPHSAIFYSDLNRDASGVAHPGESAPRSLRESANAPIFGYSTEQLGLGIVGGHLLDMGRAGELGAGVAVDMLAGKSAREMVVEPVKPGPGVFDWRELKRWGIPKSRLPEGSEVRFREPSLWESHRRAVLIGGGVIAAQALLIFLLAAARRRAREAHDSLNLAAEAAEVGLWQVDLGRRQIEGAPRWRQLFGLPREGPISIEQVIERVHPDDRQDLRRAIEEAAREGRSYRVEHRVILPGGEERWIVSRGRADQASSEGHPRSRGVSIDVTRRRRNEAEISRQREELSHLSRVGTLGVISGSLAHELNQPLGIILSNAQAAQRMLAKQDPDWEEIGEILSDIVSEDRRAGEVIQRWRGLLRRGEVIRQPVDLCDCMEEVLKLMRADLKAGDIAMDLECPEDLPKVMADRVQLQQVFLNLLVNARDALAGVEPDRKRIRLRAWMEPGE